MTDGDGCGGAAAPDDAQTWVCVCTDGGATWVVYVPDALTIAGARAVALLALRQQAKGGAPINVHELRVVSAGILPHAEE